MFASISASSSARSGGDMGSRSHALRAESSLADAPWTRPESPGKEMSMARFRSNKRAKELQRKAKHEAKEARKRERREKAAEGVDDDIDWSQAVGVTPPPGTVPSEASEEESALDDEEEPGGSARGAVARRR